MTFLLSFNLNLTVKKEIFYELNLESKLQYQIELVLNYDLRTN